MSVAETEPVDYLKLVLDLAKLHPLTTIIGIVIIAICIGISFLRPWEFFKAWQERRQNERLDAAEDAVEDLTESLSLLRMALDVARDSVERANRLRYGGELSEMWRGTAHLCDWTQRLFGFLEADVNKVTLWVPVRSGNELFVASSNGMRPESALTVRVQLATLPGVLQPFAVVAYNSRQTQICSDRDTDPRYTPLNQPSSHPYKSIIAVPVIVGPHCVGVLTIDSLQIGAFDGNDAKQLAQLCASLMGLYLAPGEVDPAMWRGLQFQPPDAT